MSINTQAADAIEAGAFVIRGGFWCQGAYAKNDAGESEFAEAVTSCAWCALGALEALKIDTDSHEQARTALNRIARKLGAKDIISFNDAKGRTAEEVADAMEAAAAALRGRE